MNGNLYERVWWLYYQCYYQELSSHALSKRYAAWDITSSILSLIAIFGSLGLGLAFWNKPDWQQIWYTVTGLAIVVSLGNLMFSVSSVKQDHITFFKEFLGLRLNIESLIGDMRSGLVTEQNEIADMVSNFDNEFRSIMRNTKFSFIFFNERFRKRLQSELDEILEKNGYNLER